MPHPPRFALLLLLLPQMARADWPVARHDTKRTATAPSTPSLITKPAPFWRYYLGGALGRRGYIAEDVNGDGKVEVVYVAGGKVLAKLPDDTLVWESAPLDLHTLVGIDDLDGDGKKDIVAFGDRKAIVLAGGSGDVEWEEPDGEMGTVGGVRLGDLDGDGRPDLFIDECGCCGVNSGSPGVAYRFGGGFAVNKPAWTSPAHARCGASGDTLGDFDGDGVLDLGYSGYGEMKMVRGRDGALLGTSAPVGTRADAAACVTADVDGRKGEEMVCFQDIYQAGGNVGGRAVWATTYDANAAPPVKVLWRHAVADVVNGAMAHAGGSLADFDGDGKMEVAVSQYDGAAWALEVYDAAGGAELARLGGSRIAAVVDLTGDGKPEILALVGNDLHAYQFARGGTPALAEFWSIGSGGGKPLEPLQQVDWSAARRWGDDARALALDLDGDKALEPIVLQPGVPPAWGALVQLRGRTKGQVSLGIRFQVEDGVSLIAAQVFPRVNRPDDQLLVTRNDGFLVILDDALTPTNAVSGGEFPVPGMRVGGFYSGAYSLGDVPIAPRFDGASADSVIARDSRGALVRLEPKGASLITPPAVAWQLANAKQPTAAPGLDAGHLGLACWAGGRLRAMRADGSEIWSVRPASGAPYHDPLAGDVNKDGVADLFTTTVDDGARAFFQVYDGKNGRAIWPAAVNEALQWGLQPAAVADWDGDGAADLVTLPNTLRVLAGPTGQALAQNPTFLAYFLPTLSDLDGDGRDEVTLAGGFYPARTLAHDLVTERWKGDDDRPYAFGARATCSIKGATQSVWVQPSLANTGLVRLVQMTGPEAGQAVTILLAGGRAFADAAAARAAGERPGLVGNATIKPGLVAPGRPSALLGSTDGWLYAVNPCAAAPAAAIDWAANLRFPVGEAILADTSGDGVDEILVTAADGYLYDIAQQIVAAPAQVLDTDPPNGIHDQDVDAIDTHDSLHAAWSAVPEADSYEVAVITQGGSYVTQPNWQNVGRNTATTVGTLPLVEGRRYLFAVRAIANGKGASVESLSNGVTVHLVGAPVYDLSVAPGPDGGAGAQGDGGGGGGSTQIHGGCSCAIGAKPARGAAGARALACLILVAALVARRRHENRIDAARPAAPTGCAPDQD